MNHPTISIIVPIFNVEKYLRTCLDSIMQQSYTNLDVILINDGSTDKSLEIAKEYLFKDSRFFLIDKPNGGLSSARNMGLEFLKPLKLRKFFQSNQEEKQEGGIECKTKTHSFISPPKFVSYASIARHFKSVCERFIQTDLEDITPFILQEMPKNHYIHFIDSDDSFQSDCIEKCVALLQQEHFGLIWHNYHFMHEQTKKIFVGERFPFDTKQWKNGLDFFKEFRIYVFAWVWKGMFLASNLNDYMLRFRHRMDYEDCDFGMILFLFSQNIIFQNFIGIRYLIREHSLSNFQKKDSFPIQMPTHLEEIKENFHTYYHLKLYFGAYCYFTIATTLLHLYQSSYISQASKEILRKSIFCYWRLTLSNLYYLAPIIKHPCAKKDPKKVLQQAQNMPFNPAQKLRCYLEINFPGFLKKMIKLSLSCARKIKKFLTSP